MKCINNRYINCLYTAVYPWSAGELHNSCVCAIPDPSPLCEGAGWPPDYKINIVTSRSQVSYNYS